MILKNKIYMIFTLLVFVSQKIYSQEDSLSNEISYDQSKWNISAVQGKDVKEAVPLLTQKVLENLQNNEYVKLVLETYTTNISPFRFKHLISFHFKKIDNGNHIIVQVNSLVLPGKNYGALHLRQIFSVQDKQTIDNNLINSIEAIAKYRYKTFPRNSSNINK